MQTSKRARPRAQITVRGLTVLRAGTTVLKDADLTIDGRSRIAIVGENGRGKSTLVAALVGALCPDSGSIVRRGRIGVAEQDMATGADRTVGDSIEFAIQASRVALAALDAAALELAADAEHAAVAYAEALDEATRLDAWDAERRVTMALEALGAVTERDRLLSSLSVGQRYRVRLACLLGGDADLLVLDEPTNHLDSAALQFLTAKLQEGTKGFAVVSHDRQLLRDVAETFVDLDPSRDGRPRVTGGGYSEWVAGKRAERIRWEQLYRDQQDAEQRLQHDLEAAQARLVDGWRPPKGTGKHQRATRAAGLVTNVKQRQSDLDARLVEIPEPPLHLDVPSWPVNGTDALLTAEDIDYSGRLHAPASMALSAGDRLLVVGPNGAGKSTLLSMLGGQLQPTRGLLTRRLSARVELLAQESEAIYRDGAEPTAAAVYRKRADQLVARGLLTEERVVPLKEVGLLEEPAQVKPIAALSLGQMRRLDLALALLAQPDVLLLDEPTNHLSISLVDELTSAISELPCAIVVSTHDRGMIQDLSEWPVLSLS
ncbi:ATP-binding cassette domain-containing protein [Leucobacter sp. HY1910]